MNVYKAKNEKYYRFPVMVTNPDTGLRKQWVISTGTSNRRFAERIKQQVDLLIGHADAGLPLTSELRKWVEGVKPTIRRRLDQIGLIPSEVTMQITPISGYVDAYLSACSFRGDGDDFIGVKRRQLARMFAEADVQTLTQLKYARIKPFFEALKAKGRSHRTLNMYRATVNAFANWLVEDEGAIEKHDLKRIPFMDVKADRRRARRPATDAQLLRLFESVPEHRSFVYRAAAMTGLRRGELRQIERRDIDLDKQTMRVRLEVSKSREEAILPLHDQMAEMLREKTIGLKPNDLVFMPVPNIRTYRRDLENVEIEYQDENGRYLDFHALRATFATRLLRHGVYPSKAIQLTRHASVKTLEDYYDMLGLSDAVDAMGQLPGLEGSVESEPEARKDADAV